MGESLVVVEQAEIARVSNVADAQKALIRCLLGILGVNVLFIIATAGAQSRFPTASLGVQFVASLIAAGFMVRLASALGIEDVIVIFVALGMFVPLLNLLLLLVVSAKATHQLRRAGVRVGFLGVTTPDLERWCEESRSESSAFRRSRRIRGLMEIAELRVLGFLRRNPVARFVGQSLVVILILCGSALVVMGIVKFVQDG